MAVSTSKAKRLRNILLRVLSFGVLLLAVRFALLLTLTDDLCFSDDNGNGDQDGVFFECLRREPRTFDLRRRRRAVEYYSSVFQDLIAQGFLSSNSKVLCVGTRADEDVAALREIGVSDSVGIVAGEAYSQPFGANTFDLEFAAEGRLDRAVRPANFAAEIGRTLKPGGFFVVHTNSAQEPYSLNSFLDLFECCRLISASEIDGLESPTVREIVMTKLESTGKSTTCGSGRKNCSVPGYKREIVLNAEPIEPSLKGKSESLKYLTSMVDISFKERYIYVDVGSRSFDSSIGNWFMKQYPKQNKTFEIFAIEADKAFHGEYRGKKEVILLPHAAWIRNETLFFEISRLAARNLSQRRRRTKTTTTTRRGGARVVMPTASYVLDGAKIRGFDFADWLIKTASRRDFVVVKMDVQGTEFYLVPRMIETGAMCLVDEFFLRCRYNRRTSHGQCLKLFSSIRERGIVVHQWW